MPTACYCHPVAQHLQVKDIPEALHAKLRRIAREEGRTIRDLVIEAVRREVDRREFRDRLRKRTSVDLGRAAARTLEEVRREREDELGFGS